MVVDGDVDVNGDGDEKRNSVAQGPIGRDGAAIVDSLQVLSMVDDTQRTKILELIGRIVSMLTRLCR